MPHSHVHYCCISCHHAVMKANHSRLHSIMQHRTAPARSGQRAGCHALVTVRCAVCSISRLARLLSPLFPAAARHFTPFSHFKALKFCPVGQVPRSGNARSRHVAFLGLSAGFGLFDSFCSIDTSRDSFATVRELLALVHAASAHRILNCTCTVQISVWRLAVAAQRRAYFQFCA